MRTKAPRPFLELFTIGLMAWTGFVYAVLFTLRFSHRMLQHQELEWIVFGPAVILLLGFAAYEVHIHRKRS